MRTLLRFSSVLALSALIATGTVASGAAPKATAPKKAPDGKAASKKAGSKDAAAKRASLTLNVKAGQSYTTSMTVDQSTSEPDGEGNEFKRQQTVGLTFTLSPTKVEADGTIHGTYSYDAVRFKVTGGEDDVDYDSAKGGAVPDHHVAQALAVLAGKKLNVVLTPQGRIKELKGGEEILAGALATINRIPARVRGTVERQMNERFGADSLKKNVEQATAIFPDGPVAVGDSWDVGQELNVGIDNHPVKLKTTYTLKSLSGKEATLVVKGTLNTDPDAAGPVPNTTYDLSGEQDGSIVLDRSTGWLVSGSVERSLRGNRSHQFGGRKVDLPMTVKTETTFSTPTR